LGEFLFFAECVKAVTDLYPRRNEIGRNWKGAPPRSPSERNLIIGFSTLLGDRTPLHCDYHVFHQASRAVKKL